MQQFKISKLLVSCAVIASAASLTVNAASTNYDVGFNTVPDIAITQVTAMDFGSGLGLASGITCAMVATDDGTATDYVGDVIMGLARATPLAAGANVGNLSGAGCTASAGLQGTPGLYEISGVAGGTVNVTINNITAGTDFNYAADGCIGNYEGNSDLDSCVTFTAGTPAAVVLAAGGDTVGITAGSGLPTVGVTRISLAGAITTTATHAAGAALIEQFTIDVTY